MPKKKKNHYVGRGIVQFWANEQGQVAYWEKERKTGFEPRNPTSVHTLDYLYATWDVGGNRDMFAEDALAKELDDHASAQVRKLLTDYPQILPLSIIQREFWARYVLRTITRNPAIIDFVLGSWAGLFLRLIFRLKRWLRRGRKPDAAYKNQGSQRAIEGDIISNLVTSNIDQLVRDFCGKRFAYIIPEEDAPNFILGSQPYFIKPDMHDQDNKYRRKDDAFCGVVIHPRMMLALFDDHDDDEIIVASSEDMRHINGIFAKYSSRIVAVSPKDLDQAWFLPFGQEDRNKIGVFNVQ